LEEERLDPVAIATERDDWGAFDMIAPEEVAGKRIGDAESD